MTTFQKYIIIQYLDVFLSTDGDGFSSLTLLFGLKQALTEPQNRDQARIRADGLNSLLAKLDELFNDPNLPSTLNLQAREGTTEASNVTAAEVKEEIVNQIKKKIVELESFIAPYLELKEKYFKVFVSLGQGVIIDDLQTKINDLKERSDETKAFFYENLVNSADFLEDILLKQEREESSTYVSRVENIILAKINDLNEFNKAEKEKMVISVQEQRHNIAARNVLEQENKSAAIAFYNTYFVTNARRLDSNSKYFFIVSLFPENFYSIKSDDLKDEYRISFNKIINKTEGYQKESLFLNLKTLSNQADKVKNYQVKKYESPKRSVKEINHINLLHMKKWLNLLRKNQWEEGRIYFSENIKWPGEFKLKSGFSIETTDEHGNTALYYALAYADVLLARDLIQQYGANVNAACVERIRYNLLPEFQTIFRAAPDWDTLITFKIDIDVWLFSLCDVRLGSFRAYYGTCTVEREKFEQSLDKLKNRIKYDFLPGLFVTLSRNWTTGIALDECGIELMFKYCQSISERLGLVTSIGYDHPEQSLFLVSCQKASGDLQRFIRYSQSCTASQEACWMGYAKLLNATAIISNQIIQLKEELSCPPAVNSTLQFSSSSSAGSELPVKALYNALESEIESKLNGVELRYKEIIQTILVELKCLINERDESVVAIRSRADLLGLSLTFYAKGKELCIKTLRRALEEANLNISSNYSPTI